MTTTKTLEILDMGRTPYAEALAFQTARQAARIADQAGDTLLLVEHPQTVTLGRRGGSSDLLLPESEMIRKGIPVFHTGRGGLATWHGPGQLVAYPVVRLPRKGLRFFVDGLLRAAVRVLESYGLTPELNVRGSGVWVGGAKVASIGLGMRHWVTQHGLALNVNNAPEDFGVIVPCGHREERITSMSRELGRDLPLDAVKSAFAAAFCEILGYAPVSDAPRRRPPWLAVQPLFSRAARPVTHLMRAQRLRTVCEEAHCPNQGECFGAGVSTFLIMGGVCTRACRYCAVHKGRPAPLDPDEPRRVAEAVRALGLRHAVITSVTRDDLPDGGAAHFAAAVRAVREHAPGTAVEVLTPDFAENAEAQDTVFDAAPDMFNHNLEAVRRVFPHVRPRSSYEGSLALLARAAGRGLKVKSGIMLGFGESWEDIRDSLRDLHAHGCRYLTLGQYLAPSHNHAAMQRYVAPDEFEHWRQTALSMGFAGVASSPRVRSSYQAAAMAHPA